MLLCCIANSKVANTITVISQEMRSAHPYKREGASTNTAKVAIMSSVFRRARLPTAKRIHGSWRYNLMMPQTARSGRDQAKSKEVRNSFLCMQFLVATITTPGRNDDDSNSWAAFVSRAEKKSFILESDQTYSQYRLRVPPMLPCLLPISATCWPWLWKRHHLQISLPSWSVCHGYAILATRLSKICPPLTQRIHKTPAKAWQHRDQLAESLDDLSQLRARLHCSLPPVMRLTRKAVAFIFCINHLACKEESLNLLGSNSGTATLTTKIE